MFKMCIDTGGTFTDCIVMEENNDIHEFKAPTTPGEFSQGVIDAITYGSEFFGMTLSDFLKDTEYIIHGTTVATNALVEHTTAKTAMVTTEGFRDIIEMRQCNKIATHSIFEGYIPPYVPYVERRYRYAVAERTAPTGEVKTEVDFAGLDSIIEDVKKEGIEAIAVCFINSYQNPENEKKATDYLKEKLPEVYITNSSTVLPKMGEYERFSTCVISACLGPIVEKYLTTLERRLKEYGFEGQLLIVQSNQFVQSVPSIIDKPVYLSNSGPSAGPVGAVKLSDVLPERNYLIGDMGGTTWDASLVFDAKVSLASTTWLGDDLIGIKMAEVLSIGAGGGSIAYINPMGLLSVGPRSASAYPGPACYQRGGTEPTVTDAALTLGFINPDNFNGGKLKLSKELAREAIKKVAEPLGLTIEEAAEAIFTTVNHNMADGISVISTRKGYDIRDFSLLAVGGGGPLCGASVANVLGMNRCIIPKFCASFCAKSMFSLDIGRDYVRSYIRSFDDIVPEEIDALVDDMRSEAAKDFEYFGVTVDQLKFELSADAHYANQYHELELELPKMITKGKIEEMKASFHKVHKDTFTFDLPWVPIQIVNVRMTARFEGDHANMNKIPKGTADALVAIKEMRTAYVDGKFQEIPIYDGDRLLGDNRFNGPCVIEQTTVTAVIPSGNVVTVSEFGDFIVDRVEA